MAADPTRKIVGRALRDAFPALRPDIELRRRGKSNGYSLTFIYSQKDDVKPPSHDEIHQALADRLLVNQTKMTLDEARARFAIKLYGIGNVRVIGVTDGIMHHRLDGVMRADRSQRVSLFLDLPQGESAHPAAAALFPAASFVSAMNTDAVVPPEMKGKLLTAEQADALEPPRAKQKRRA